MYYIQVSFRGCMNQTKLSETTTRTFRSGDLKVVKRNNVQEQHQNKIRILCSLCGWEESKIVQH